jgi:hypothetical protein
MTTCISCQRDVEKFEERYRQAWCLDCLPRIEFEERRARDRGITIREVLQNAAGDITVVLERDGQSLSEDDLRAITPKREEVLDEIMSALIALGASVHVDAEYRVVRATPDAPIAARRLIALLDDFAEPLGYEADPDALQWRQIAERILAGQPLHIAHATRSTH